MSVRIRLRRVGRKKQPYYRVVVMANTAPRDGAYIDHVGFYNPRTRPAVLTMDLAKVDAWIEKGAEVTDSAASLIRKARKGGDKAIRLVEPGAEGPALKTTTRPERRAVSAAPPSATPTEPPAVEEPTDTLEAAAPDAEQAPPAESMEAEATAAVEAAAPEAEADTTTEPEAPKTKAKAEVEVPEAEAPEAAAEASGPTEAEAPAAEKEAPEGAAEPEAPAAEKKSPSGKKAKAAAAKPEAAASEPEPEAEVDVEGDADVEAPEARKKSGKAKPESEAAEE